MPIDFYYIWESPPCHSVLLLGKTLGINFNTKYIDYYVKKEHRSPEFRKINPQHSVPVIDDNGFIVCESRAILAYLVEQYAKDDALYPKDVKKRTVINQRLYFDIGTMYQSLLDNWEVIAETGKLASEKVDDAFEILEVHLDGKEWVAGNDISIADYSLVASVASIESCGFDVSKYPNVVRWYSKCKKIPGYDETIGNGNVQLKKLLESLKKK